MTTTDDRCIVVGVSTGGPAALSALFGRLVPPLPPVVVVQHMPPQFTRSLAWRLDALSELKIQEAQRGGLLLPNHGYIAPGGRHMRLCQAGRQTRVLLDDGPPVSRHKPSIDVLMQSVAHLYGPRALGIIMTGMGRDGVAGCAAIRSAGGQVFGQDEASSDVYGMNKAAYLEGHVDRQFHLDEAPEAIAQWLAQLDRSRAGQVR